VTTTLRPAGPEERGPDGARDRGYAVCVNGREVGRIRLATDRRAGAGDGRVVSLDVDEPDRGRGRGAVAALAAEEVLRGWGCRRVSATVPAEAGSALRLARSLGYTERARGMVKRLTSPPALPAGAALRPMAEGEYERWFERTGAEYVGRLVADGLAPERAAALADADRALTLPDGVRTAGTALRVLADSGADVGWLWVRIGPAAAGAPAGRPWVHLVEVAEPRRGRGHGRTLMLAAERECLAAGVQDLGLNVFTGNAPALRLCESLGYEPMSYELFKPLL
jgi:GNAT superfamily N-acetyltransferase